MNKQIGMLTVLATILVTSAFLATPNFKVANAQANETKGLNVDGWIKTLKENHPTLAAIEQAADVKDVITKIKAMDAKEAVKDLLALHILSDLMELKTAQETP
jgi:dethiobiotin synthetase